MSFDLLAPHYRRLERLLAGERLQRCRLAHLEAIADARELLLLGEGPGRFLEECHRRLPSARITCLDSSPRMLRLAEGRTGSCLEPGRLNFVQADAREWTPPSGAFDLLVSHFFLDCFTGDQLGRIIPALSEGLRPQGRWLVSEFRLPASRWPRFKARFSLWLAYRFFRLTTRCPARCLPDPDPLLTAAGFRREARREFEDGFLSSDLWRRVRSG